MVQMHGKQIAVVFSGTNVVLRGAGNYRITWQKKTGRVVVEKQRPFSLFRLINFLHFQAGYGRHSWVTDLWALSVDVASISMWL